jgi:DNA repair exonuclease SbcCD ATPase subunit
LSPLFLEQATAAEDEKQPQIFGGKGCLRGLCFNKWPSTLLSRSDPRFCAQEEAAEEERQLLEKKREIKEKIAALESELEDFEEEESERLEKIKGLEAQLAEFQEEVKSFI